MGEQLSGSRLPVLRHCAYSFRDDVTFPDNRAKEDDADADDGTHNHELFSTFVEKGHFPPVSPSKKILCNHVREFWGERGRWSVESAYALNPSKRSVRFLGNRIDRKYVVTEGEIPLTLDYEGYERGVLVVGDWKGFGAHVEEPRKNLQLLTQACAAELYAQQNGRPPGPVRLEIPHVTERGVYCPEVEISQLVLLAVMAELAVLLGRIKQTPEPIAGDHCRYCNVNGACPATREVVRVIAGEASAAQWTSEFVSVDNDRAILRELSAVKKAIEAIDRAVKTRNAGGIDMGDGYAYRNTVSQRTVPDREKIEAHLGDRYLEFTKKIEVESFRRVKA